ncbi:unnamed protein product [Ambrosiozyma monospora]|uniref:Unnamed protein product n=1 Tax=Ambrosiozyma monospora TaxID=43982 RepID=A0A9W6Z5H4_AMBMO|nr:unnamed protein product [Ambrosiozyma monospora]
MTDDILNSLNNLIPLFFAQICVFYNMVIMAKHLLYSFYTPGIATTTTTTSVPQISSPVPAIPAAIPAAATTTTTTTTPSFIPTTENEGTRHEYYKQRRRKKRWWVVLCLLHYVHAFSTVLDLIFLGLNFFMVDKHTRSFNNWVNLGMTVTSSYSYLHLLLIYVLFVIFKSSFAFKWKNMLQIALIFFLIVISISLNIVWLVEMDQDLKWILPIFLFTFTAILTLIYELLDNIEEFDHQVETKGIVGREIFFNVDEHERDRFCNRHVQDGENRLYRLNYDDQGSSASGRDISRVYNVYGKRHQLYSDFHYTEEDYEEEYDYDNSGIDHDDECSSECCCGSENYSEDDSFSVDMEESQSYNQIENHNNYTTENSPDLENQLGRTTHVVGGADNNNGNDLEFNFFNDQTQQQQRHQLSNMTSLSQHVEPIGTTSNHLISPQSVSLSLSPPYPLNLGSWVIIKSNQYNRQHHM